MGMMLRRGNISVSSCNVGNVLCTSGISSNPSFFCVVWDTVFTSPVKPTSLNAWLQDLPRRTVSMTSTMEAITISHVGRPLSLRQARD